MNITILCSDERHPVNAWLARWIELHRATHAVELVRRRSELGHGDILFLVSCAEVITAADRARYAACLVLHASDLPHGRGWSPHVWEILGGATSLTVTLLDAADPPDTGAIWAQVRVDVPRHALLDEIHARLFDAELDLMGRAVREFGRIVPRPQAAHGGTRYRRRTPEDSRLDPEGSLAAQFDLLRICDPVRYPAFFELHGHRYKLTIEKLNDSPDRH